MSARRGSGGFSLIELLVAIALAGGLLASAWGWAWAVTAAGARADDAHELRSALAYAQRTLGADLRGARRLAPEAGPGCTESALTLHIMQDDAGARDVPIVFDPVRDLLWRLTSSCHLIDGVTDCRFSYYDGGGMRLDCSGGLTPGDAARVRRVGMHLLLQRGEARLETEWTAVLGGGL